MGLFKNKGRADIEAWAKALIQGYKKGMPVDRSVLEKETDQSFRNDCRIIKESIQIVMRSSDYDIREKRKKLIEERYQHLKILLPFADSEQLKLYDDVMDQINCLNQHIENRNETQKENIRQRRRQKQDAFWEVTGSSYMLDEFSDLKKKDN
ncbi:MAG: hypothetical protein ACI4EI_02980 [Muricoprocola sp.]|uniref:hypothetical protein n=1 Tax=Faecalicatena contorta TaxID=39482 RepID=UPI001F24DB15|nr:hypothetical protein [Faecalicatena contorta]MCF2681152.1 hypothetical protein [Faecalicatena contorta]